MDTFLAMLKQERIRLPETEYRFHPERKWRFDYAYPDKKIAIEQEGGVWIGGRHNRASGFLKDLEKYNAAAVLGWRILRYTPEKMTTDAVDDLKKILKDCG